MPCTAFCQNKQGWSVTVRMLRTDDKYHTIKCKTAAQSMSSCISAHHDLKRALSILFIILMRLIYKTLMNINGILEGIQPETTVGQLKTLLYALQGFLPDHTRLVCHGRNTDNRLPLSEYGMKDGDTIYIVFRFR